RLATEWGGDGATIGISATTGAGIDTLIQSLKTRVAALLGAGDPPVVTRARHRRAVEDALGHLRQFLEGGAEIELLAEELRLAARAMGRVTGRVDVEDILDVVFGSFCIGK
ncbi:MAG: tRNA uridine-5-carboxymethylaminomethyl(34) synthesis GTPase MnmE, partial [Sphingomonadales bacterium]